MSHSDPSTTQSLVCMEIWGGNQATNRTVKTPGLDLWVYSRPHEDVEGGGDVHYVSLCGGGRITRFVLADVSGHGTTVAELAKSLRLLMRKNINRKDQTRFVQSLNREFSELSKLNRFATAVVATYLTGGDTLTVCNAGHPRPLYYRAGTSSWAVLRHDETLADGPADLPLGILEETGYTQVQLHLGPGDLVLFYTDALTEAEAPDGQRLNEEGLIGILQKLDCTKPSEIPSALLTALDQFRGGQPADDDMTFLLLHHNAGPAQPPGILDSFRVFAQVLGLKSV